MSVCESLPNTQASPKHIHDDVCTRTHTSRFKNNSAGSGHMMGAIGKVLKQTGSSVSDDDGFASGTWLLLI
jgi:hypothetical protein